ncbi:MAG: SAM-dependent methyltransferase [Ilumatobacteraceae bacterium]
MASGHHDHAASDDLRRAIVADGGLLRFDKFIDITLYGEHGFYSTTGRAGRRGDFITSPEVGPLFGAVLARALDTWWDELGRPDPFTVVDAGAGPGTLSRAILTANPRCSSALRYVAVEVSETQRALHPTGVESRAEMPSAPFVGVIIANELLDNLPFRLFVFDGGWREAFVETDGERFVERLVTTSDIPHCLPPAAAHGARIAIQDAAVHWVSSALSLLNAGRLVVFDYCTTSVEMASRPWRQWLRTYSTHERGLHYLQSVGLQDVTVEVAIDQLPSPTVVTTQAEFLREFGIDQLVAEGRAAWRDAATSPTVTSMMMRSRVREAESLCDPGGLGGFSVLQWRR